MRKLATIQRILDINPIPDADSIERVTVKGWNVVSQKGIHKVGDLVVYIEIDSMLPIRPEFEFLRKTSYRQLKDGTEGFVLRTVRMRGQVSQGLILPFSALLDFKYDGVWSELDEGSDVTEILGIKLFEEPIPDEILAQAKGMSPSFVPDSSQARVQNSQPLVERYAGHLYRKTEKLDGWAATFYLYNNVFGACSRGVDFKDLPGNPYWEFARRVDLEARMRLVLQPGENLILQGELVGEGICKNKYKLTGKHVYFYNARSQDGEDISVDLILDVLNQIQGEKLHECPLLNANYILPSTVDQLVEDSKFRSKLNPDVWAEGFVAKHKLVNHDFNGRTSIKVINPNFLLKYND
jgi:RNA ligase (TIGR02306 family)